MIFDITSSAVILVESSTANWDWVPNFYSQFVSHFCKLKRSHRSAWAFQLTENFSPCYTCLKVSFRSLIELRSISNLHLQSYTRKVLCQMIWFRSGEKIKIYINQKSNHDHKDREHSIPWNAIEEATESLKVNETKMQNRLISTES